MNKTSLYWTTTITFVDLETGEIIKQRTKEETIKYIKQNYIIIKKTKHVTTKNGKGYIDYTIKCRQRPKQGELNLI